MDYNEFVNKSYLLVALNLNLIPVQKLFAETGLSENDLISLESLPLPTALKMIENIARHCEIANWRSIFGAHIGVSAHGPVGFASLTAATVGKAVATFIEWERVQSPTYEATTSIEENEVVIKIVDKTGNEIFEEFFFEALSRAMEVLVMQLCGLAQQMPTMHFKTNAQDRATTMSSEYLSTLRFNSRCNLMCFPIELWNLASPLYNRELHELNLQNCRSMLMRQQNESRIDVKVQYLLQSHFQTVISQQQRDVTSCPMLSDVCSQLYMSQRTLIRKLKALNRPFKVILEEVRKQLAAELLRDARYNVFDVASLLGYQEAANFCRAFKRWFGVSPSQFRKGVDKPTPGEQY